MVSKERLAKQKKAATYIAKIMHDSLRKFPEEEQERRIRAIERVSVRSKNGKSSKHASKPRNLRVRQQA